ncbi:MAG: calcium/sodium antiporter [Pirellulaceae bacterium]
MDRKVYVFSDERKSATASRLRSAPPPRFTTLIASLLPLDWISNTPFLVVLLILGISISVLGKAASVLVDHATILSLIMGIPRLIVGATIVSLGTTLPEAFVSVLAAFAGEPEIALGNAVGSIICDTGLILGIGCLLAPLPVDREVVYRQGLIQFLAPLLLIALCTPWTDLPSVWTDGGVLSQRSGWLLLVLLFVYIVWTIRAAKAPSIEIDETDEDDSTESPTGPSIAKHLGLLILAIALVVLSSEILVAGATDVAERLNVPEGVIAATLIAFGTSVSELVIVVTSILKGHGELAIGNVVGADILNVLFVAGASAAVTPAGLSASPDFYRAQFPTMVAVLVTFRIALAFRRDDMLPRWTGFLLVGFYALYLGFAFQP